MVYCCGRHFYYDLDSSHRQHLRTSPNHNWCEDCDVDFQTWTGLKEHYVQSPAHSYCQQCNELFYDDNELEYHHDSEHIRCVPCRRFFKNDLGLHEHYRQSPVHSSKYCPRDIVCPGYQCGQRFVSQSALILHFEAGSCRSGINRTAVNRFVRENDRQGIITNPSRLITGPSSTETTYYATSAAWNGHAYECYLCHGEYRSLTALNQHLASPRHQDRIYFCPLSSCRETFSTLSGLCQHIESERCGVLRFRPVRDALDGLVSGMRRITVN
ncbi:hypothetical protein FA13DRAFT_1724539 [Coprinellus micaceus]|uniref:C2H2-type domain-containing protein n=1 Tax=Coprinellus micaceus TaxID=71717 RepID=A0A4Y7TWR9_COPMI|nr:hypothetical protein FA13DRAFT_1724539 [Coprinellus micaceus]